MGYVLVFMHRFGFYAPLIAHCLSIVYYYNLRSRVQLSQGCDEEKQKAQEWYFEPLQRMAYIQSKDTDKRKYDVHLEKSI